MGNDSTPLSDPKDKVRRDAFNESLRVAMQPAAADGGLWAVIIAFVALVMSAFSLYESNLKQAQPEIYVGGVIQYGQDTLEPSDVFIVPVTITNSGARDVVILELHLQVARADGAAPVWTAMSGLYNGGRPREDKTLFTPISVPGGDARTANVLFYRDSLVGGAPGAIVSGNQAFRFCLGGRLAAADYSAILGKPVAPRIAFEAETSTFAREDLIAGRTVTLRVRGARAVGEGGGRRDGTPDCG